MSNIITEKNFRFELTDGKKKERLDKFLTSQLENATRSRIQKLIDAEFVLVNGKKENANYLVRAKDIIEVTIPISPRPEFAEPEEIPLDIVYEDEYLLVVNKPAGMVAHPAYGNYTGTLVNALLHHTSILSDLNENPTRPGIVHRIDKNTSGLLLIAKNEAVHAGLALQFSKHTVEREYWAIIWGRMKTSEGIIDTYIARSKKDRKVFVATESEGKHAITNFTVLEQYLFTSLISLKLKTGRTHQIRVHLSSLGKPIFGDVTYGGTSIHAGEQTPKLKTRVQNLLEIMPRQALHAKTLGFIHPVTKEFLRFDSEPPKDFQDLLVELRKT